MLITLNNESVATGGHPAIVDMFPDSGSIVHVGLGLVAGGLLNPKAATLLLAAFTGYQVSQADTGEPWSRTGGEFLEFSLGMLAGMSAKYLYGS